MVKLVAEFIFCRGSAYHSLAYPVWKMDSN